MFLLFVSFLLLISFLTKNDINKNEKTTIGFVYDIDGGTATASPSLIYKYSVDGKIYESTTSFSGNELMFLNHFYKVRYSFKHPSRSEIVLDSLVSDTIQIKKAGLIIPKREMKKDQFQN